MSHIKKPLLRDGLILWVCAKCREPKVADEFHKCRGTPNGLYHTCKICQRAISNAFYRKKKRRLAKMQRELAALKARQ